MSLLEEAPGLSSRLDIRALAVARRSTSPATWAIGEVHPLTPEKLTMILTTFPGAPDPKAPLARISAPHHMLARFIAEGKPDPEVSAVTGYSLGRIRALKLDPAFAELVAHYEEQAVMAQADVQAQITHITLTAGQLLMERLEDEGADLPLKDLQSLFQSGLDRIGHGPGAKVDVRVTDTAKIIQALQETIQSNGRVLSRADVIDADCEEVPDEPAPES